MRWGAKMRDISGDLQERANLLKQQTNSARAEFEKLIEQIKWEHDSKLKDLRAELGAVNRVTEIEHRRLRSAASAPLPQSQQPQPQQSRAMERVGV